jgi:hypothetical protein
MGMGMEIQHEREIRDLKKRVAQLEEMVARLVADWDRRTAPPPAGDGGKGSDA